MIRVQHVCVSRVNVLWMLQTAQGGLLYITLVGDLTEDSSAWTRENVSSDYVWDVSHNALILIKHYEDILVVRTQFR